MLVMPDVNAYFSPLFIGEVLFNRSFCALFSARYRAAEPEFFENPQLAGNAGRICENPLPQTGYLYLSQALPPL